MKRPYMKPAIRELDFNADDSMLAGSGDLQMDVYDEPLIMEKNEIRVKPFTLWDPDDEMNK